MFVTQFFITIFCGFFFYNFFITIFVNTNVFIIKKKSSLNYSLLKKRHGQLFLIKNYKKIFSQKKNFFCKFFLRIFSFPTFFSSFITAKLGCNIHNLTYADNKLDCSLLFKFLKDIYLKLHFCSKCSLSDKPARGNRPK